MDEGDLILDAFCGSGTTCVAAKSLHRSFIAMDLSEDAIEAINNSELAKKCDLKIVIQTNNCRQLFSLEVKKIKIIKSYELLINEELNKIINSMTPLISNNDRTP